MNTITSCNPEKTIKHSSSSWGRLRVGVVGEGRGEGHLAKLITVRTRFKDCRWVQHHSVISHWWVAIISPEENISNPCVIYQCNAVSVHYSEQKHMSRHYCVCVCVFVYEGGTTCGFSTVNTAVCCLAWQCSLLLLTVMWAHLLARPFTCFSLLLFLNNVRLNWRR